MSQMSSSDQAIIKALPGNDRCMECGMKHPQWASVSFGTVFCLECSGVHRSLGVHISFVRSIAMDSWQEKQLGLMKAGGNGKCASYLSSNGILPSTPIKAKYESPVAQHYKEVVKARAQGAPDPPMSKAPAPKPNRVSSSNKVRAAAGEDPNGMERLTGETDEQYIARQTRLKNEAKARMAAKFGGGGGRMGGVGSGGMGSGGIGSKPMSGIGSDSSYNPQTGGYGSGGGGIDMDTIVTGFCSGFSTLGFLGKSGIETASSALQDQKSMNEFTGSVRSGGMSLWNTISSAASDIATNMTEPDSVGGDGLSDFRAHVQQNKSANSDSKYKGFGSDNWNSGPSSNRNSNGTSIRSPPNLDFAAKKTVNTAPAPRRNPAVATKNTKMNMDTMKKNMNSDDFFSSFGA